MLSDTPPSFRRTPTPPGHHRRDASAERLDFLFLLQVQPPWSEPWARRLHSPHLGFLCPRLPLPLLGALAGQSLLGGSCAHWLGTGGEGCPAVGILNSQARPLRQAPRLTPHSSPHLHHRQCHEWVAAFLRAPGLRRGAWVGGSPAALLWSCLDPSVRGLCPGLSVPCIPTPRPEPCAASRCPPLQCPGGRTEPPLWAAGPACWRGPWLHSTPRGPREPRSSRSGWFGCGRG